jgi:flagellar FliL protein
MAEETAEAPEAAPRKGRGKLVLVVGIVGLLGAGGGVAWYLGFLPPGGKAEAKATAEKKKAEKPPVGAMRALDTFIANLADEDGKRYLKATFQLEFFDANEPEHFAAREPQVRDLLLTLFTSKTFAEIRTPEGKAVLRDEIINRVNRILRKDVVKAVYFTEFIVQ